jgi:electron transport complex protein RnfG
MKDIAKLIIVLTVICAVSGSMMAVVNDMTKDRIREANERAKLEAMKSVLPEFDNNPVEDAKAISADGEDWTFFIAKQASQFVGAAFVSTSHKGYSGDIHVMVGVSAKNKILAIEILTPHKETPGLGARITEYDFRCRFIDKDININETKWAVTKDGGDIDQISAATISSRAVVEAVKQGLNVFIANEDEIKK